MSYSTVMVHLDAGGPNSFVLEAAAKVAKGQDAKVIGVAACQPMQIASSADDATGATIALECEIANANLDRAEQEFRAFAAIEPFVLEWRSINTMEPVAHAIADDARCADLLIASACQGHLSNTTSHANIGDLIVRAGRPVLVVPEGPAPATFAKIFVAWADTRECRRAVADALPFLAQAAKVIVVEIAAESQRARSPTHDVVAWLGRHKVSADRIVYKPHGNIADSLAILAREQEADLIVAGAYGHNRLREWAFGGVTRDVLLRENRCAFLSH
jgi:nucleotide-binding universal stress UspA family protein